MFLKLCQYVKDLLNIWYVNQFVTQKMCNVQENPWVLEHVPDQYKTQEMYNEVVEKSPWMFEHVPDQFVTQKMCDEAVKKSPCALWYKGYEQRKAQKAKIKEELMPVAWHPDRWCNWCVPGQEKKRPRNLLCVKSLQIFLGVS